MKKRSSAEIRQLFLDFFEEKGHQIEPSAPLVPIDDPSLLWINSGVATLKKYFDGTIIPDNPRLVNAQKAIRTNDIENVGYTARHHTFFEMLGNFSIGDYFKEEAIQLAWEFLTSDDWLGLEEELLSVTVHPEDDEAYDIWLHAIKLPKHRIIRLEENFWDIGEGPSGPNTEIFYDRGPDYGNDPSDPELYPGGENSRYLEIWNLVFSQFNHNPDDTYTPLPNKNIDTGMGLERIVSIIQDVPTNFETDLFMPLINEIETLTNLTYGEDENHDIAFKVIADHIRTVTFAIGDGAIPANEGRGYVLRRLIRRAVRFAKQIGFEEPFMYKLVAIVGDIMKDFYPEIMNQQAHIKNVIKNEEERFYETLNDGLSMLSNIITQEKSKGNTVFPGEEIFKLYDTYGFPKELTEEYVAEHGFSIDEDGFNIEMKKQQERARSARQHVDSMQVQDDILNQIKDESSFIGYDHSETKTTIVKMIHNGEFIETANKGDTVYLVLNETPFYAESGGQVADKGTIFTETAHASVKDVSHAPKGQHIHQVVLKEGDLHVGEEVHTVIERDYRNGIIKNHTATHLLHQALKDVLGKHVNQAGSLVGYDRLRFDFTHFEAVSDDELNKIEQIINERIWESISLSTKNMDIDKAKEIGAMALFGEKYGDIVRVVLIGDYSIELCGGCHVQNTAEIGLFKIVSESGIGAGTRRIEAVTSKGAYQFMAGKLNLLSDLADKLKVSENKAPAQIDKLLNDIQTLQIENESLSDKLLNIESSSMIDQVKKVKGVNVLTEKVNANNMNQLRNMVDDFKEEIKSGVVLLASQNGNKVQLAAGITKDLIKRGLHAGHLINEVAKQCEGGGGGRPDMAQAGGNNPEKIGQALQVPIAYITEQLDK